jgi:hypothetical protein
MHRFIAVLATAIGALLHGVGLIHPDLESGKRTFQWVFRGFLGTMGIVVRGRLAIICALRDKIIMSSF